MFIDKTGPLEAYAKQTQTGLMMGLDYATGGTMTVNGNNLVVIEKDNQGKPDVAKSQLAAAYADDRADIAVGPTSSGAALAMLPVAEEYKKILLVEPAVADAITGEKWNRYIFRTSGNPFKIADLDPKRYGIEIATGGNILPAMTAYKNFPGMEGAAYYYFGIPKNPVNSWLVTEHYKQFKQPPDFFTAGGMAAGIALVEALKKTGGATDTEKLISAMEGMSFESPKGRMTFRKEDHQAMQSMYHFKIKVDLAFAWGVPELVREIKPEEMQIPIRNKR